MSTLGVTSASADLGAFAENDSMGADAGTGDGGGSPGGPRKGSDGCDYQPAATTTASPDQAWSRFNGVKHWYYSKICNDAFVGTVWIPLHTPADVLVQARQRVERTLPEPTPLMVWPDPDYDWAYAQVPIDFRVGAAQWRAFEETATAVTVFETVSVTIRAEPRELVFTAGDPAAIAASAVCSDGEPLAGYDPYAPGACSYTYINASSTARNGRAFTASMTITWDIRYWSTTDPSFAGTLPSITRETLFPIEVAEVKILSVGTRP